MAFLACMDEKKGLAPSAAASCAKTVGLDEGKLKTCYSGSQGQALLLDASKVNDAAHVSFVPYTLVGDKQVNADFKTLEHALCQSGAKADVCKKDAVNTVCHF